MADLTATLQENSTTITANITDNSLFEYSYKGSCATSALPTSPSTGDMWYLTDSGTYGSAGTCVSWSGSAWVALSALQGMTVLQSQIDTINTDLSLSSTDAFVTAASGITVSTFNSATKKNGVVDFSVRFGFSSNLSAETLLGRINNSSYYPAIRRAYLCTFDYRYRISIYPNGTIATGDAIPTSTQTIFGSFISAS